MRRDDSLEKTDAGRDWGQEEKGMTAWDVWWHHWLDGRESEWTPGVGDGQGGLACCDSWGLEESDTTEWLNWTELTSRYTEPIKQKHRGVWYSENYKWLPTVWGHVCLCVLRVRLEAEDSMYNEIRLQTDCTQNPVLRNWTVKKKRKEKETGL